jgi:hypothetical protein
MAAIPREGRPSPLCYSAALKYSGR